MALAVPLPPADIDLQHATSEADDEEEIAQVRAEIQALSQRHSLLKASILSSTKAQAWLQERQTNASSFDATQDDLPPLLASSKQTTESNIHRLALGVTSFPFTDPSPECQSLNPLLGVRFDICKQGGRYTKPYYLFCRRVSPSSQELRIHRHTIPSLVPLHDYEKQYLPLADEGYGGSEDSFLSNREQNGSRTQDLHALVRRVRQDLVSWRLRVDAIDLVRDHLELPPPKTKPANGQHAENGDDGGTDGDEEMSDNDFESCGKFGVRQLEICNADGSQVRILWADDRVGRIKLSRDGEIVKAAVFSGDGQLGEQERILSSGSATVYDLARRLEKLHNTVPQSS